MNKLKNYFKIIFIFIFIYLLFKYNNIVNKSVVDATYLWFKKVFPSLFIMFILNDIIINSNILNNFTKFINPIFNKIFNTFGNSSLSFLLSIISGTPSSAFILKEMLNNSSISINDANKLISFTYFSNPLFLYNILSNTFNKKITIKIILIHYITNIFIGLLFRKKDNNNNNKTIKNKSNINEINIIKLLPSSINKSINTLFMILGTIVFYMIITNLILNIFNINNLFNIFLRGIFEITQSLNLLNNLNYPSITKELMALSIISFGGLSIHTQVLSIINDTDISYKNFLIGRILHFLLGTITYIFIYYVIPC